MIIAHLITSKHKFQQKTHSEGREVEDGICKNIDPVNVISSYHNSKIKIMYLQPREGERYAEGVEEISEDELHSIAEELTKEELEELEVPWKEISLPLGKIFLSLLERDFSPFWKEISLPFGKRFLSLVIIFLFFPTGCEGGQPYERRTVTLAVNNPAIHTDIYTFHKKILKYTYLIFCAFIL